MTTDNSPSHEGEQDWVLANVSGQVNGAPLRMRVPVPKAAVHPGELLPIYQQMTHALVDLGVQRAESEGKSISCRAGCGACCRQLVPISEIEARQLAALVASLPEPRQTEIRKRFESAWEQLDASPWGAPLRDPERFSDEELSELGLGYFQLGIPCPFLEQESCSIHPDRPLACREYLVTSPAEHCSDPTPQAVDQVRIPAKMSTAVMRLSRPTSSRFIPHIPLLRALDWVERNPDQMQPQTGPDILKNLLESLFAQEVKSE